MRLVIGWSFLLLILLGFGAAAASGWTYREPYQVQVQRMGRLRQKFLYYHQPGGVPAALAKTKDQEAIASHLSAARALLSRLAIIRQRKGDDKGLSAAERGALLAEVVERQKRLRGLAVAPRIPSELLRPINDNELRDDAALVRRLETLVVVEEALESLESQPDIALQSLDVKGVNERSTQQLLVLSSARDIPLSLKIRGPRAAIDGWLRSLAADVDADEERVPFFLASLKLGFLPNSPETVAELSIFALAIELRDAQDVRFAPAETEAEALGEEE